MLNLFTFQARVTKKSDIKQWNNAKGKGHLFTVDLVDDSGEIRGIQ